MKAFASSSGHPSAKEVVEQMDQILQNQRLLISQFEEQEQLLQEQNHLIMNFLTTGNLEQNEMALSLPSSMTRFLDYDSFVNGLQNLEAREPVERGESILSRQIKSMRKLQRELQAQASGKDAASNKENKTKRN